jgi:transposase
MLGTKSSPKVYLACGATDMRKSINGLCMLVSENFKLDPFEQAVFVFCNRSRDRMKILSWDENGFWLYFKRLEKGHFRWPQQDEIAETINLNYAELLNLLESTKIEQKLKKSVVLERKIS